MEGDRVEKESDPPDCLKVNKDGNFISKHKKDRRGRRNSESSDQLKLILRKR